MPKIKNDRFGVKNSKNTDEADQPAVTMLFGKYELGKLLGYGAFAKVYRAKNIITGESVAIKAVSKRKVLKGGLTTNVKREISIMRRLDHPNVVSLHEVLATKTKIYFVMEFAKGGELFSKISKGRFSEDLSRKYFQQLITAVRYCHQHGVFHRDLKPENLLLDDNWNLKVSDFGLSAVTDQVQTDGLLHTLCGTPAYVAPEILTKKGYDGAGVDVWSCGVTLYVLSTGYLPFNDSNLMVLYQKIYKGDFRFPRWTSPDLRRLISRHLDTNPETRITVDEIFRDPWFREGYKEVNFNNLEDSNQLKVYGNEENAKCLNAFDLISLSSGLNLTGLVNDPENCSNERFLSAEPPERIIQRVAAVAKTENVIVVRKGWGVTLQGQNGNLEVVIDIFRLTEKLIMVEIKEREMVVGPTQKIWKCKLRPMLDSLIYQSVLPVSVE